MIIQVKDDGLDQDGACAGGGKQLYSKYILKIELTKFADRLEMMCGR